MHDEGVDVSGALLRSVTLVRLDDGRWKLTRERDEGGETFTVDDLMEAFAVIDAAYRPDGTPRPWPRRPTVLCSTGALSPEEAKRG